MTVLTQQLRDLNLDDKYTAQKGQIYLTGTQALVRLTLDQAASDSAKGWNTAGFVSGYRGSPLGTVDQEFGRAKRFAEATGVRFHPGVNEDLAATSVWGTQQVNLLEKDRVEGVFSMWYGKGPGVDRSGDVLRHGNLAGSNAKGGVLLLAGDDHTCKSSTTAHQTEYAFVDAMIPVLNPAGLADILAYGRFGWALSRYSGCWTAMKLIAETMDSSGCVSLDPARGEFNLPTDFEMPEGGLSIRWPDTPQTMEERLHTLKIPAARAFARANGINKITHGTGAGTLGLITTGKSYLDVLSAFDRLGFNEQMLEKLGLSVLKIGMPWPLDSEGVARFAERCDRVLVIEEKRPLIEDQLRSALYQLAADKRPLVIGKTTAEGAPLLPAYGDFGPTEVIGALRQLLLDRCNTETAERLAALSAKDDAVNPASVARIPYFCSGCPHNTSTRVPDGSRAMAGIGCSYMAQWMDRDTDFYTQMGAEGANWIGLAPFSSTNHVFQNIGDGTYFHSGLMAIRAAASAGVNITYKILFNDAVAMTGGQQHDGQLTPQVIAEQVRAEGVETVVVVSDDIDKYVAQQNFPKGVKIHHRDELEAVQKDLVTVKGVSVLIYDQTCAAEKRRRRKRGTMPDPDKRILINELVCEGCGDCSAKSNCLSVVPKETEFGAKRTIDQSSCNKDFSCVKGFCPSFVTVEGGKLRKKKAASGDVPGTPLPDPVLPDTSVPWRILVTGVGGTGVVTIGALLAMAANLEGRAGTTLDMAGLAQKGGQVTSHVTLANRPEDIGAVRVPDGTADLVLGCDLVVAGGKEALSVIAPAKTQVVLNGAETITADFIRNRSFRLPGDDIIDIIRARAGDDQVFVADASRLAVALLGDSIGANLFMVGLAYQKGLIPLSADAIERAIELNGVAIDANKRAFLLGRHYSVDWQAVEALARPAPNAALEHRNVVEGYDEVVARRVTFLADYQNAKYAETYRRTVATLRGRIGQVTGTDDLSIVVAKHLFKLMAYKDEYEVARLYTGAAFQAQLDDAFESYKQLTFHLAPPLLSGTDPNTNEPRKRRFGPWMLRAFAVLAKFKGVRGTWADPFGYTAERRMERDLIDDYLALAEQVVSRLEQGASPNGAADLLNLPDEIRGFGPVKERSVAAYHKRKQTLLAESDVPTPAVAAE